MLTTIERSGDSSSTTRPTDPAEIRRVLAERIRATEIRSHDRPIGLEPGRVVALHGPPGSGMTRVGLGLLAEPARQAPVVAVDVRGWISPLAAWEVGIPPERFVVVRDVPEHQWPTVLGTLVDGVRAVYAEVPAGTPAAVVRRVAAAVRARRVGLVLRPLRGEVPAGIAHLVVEAGDVRWAGVGAGVGHLAERSIALRTRGKAVAGIERVIEVDDHGAHPVPLVGRVAAASARRATR